LISDFSPTHRQVRHWDKAAAFAAIAVLSPIIILALEAGTVARVRAIISGTRPATVVQPLVFMPQTDAVAWAWVVFFLALALVYALDTGRERTKAAEPDQYGDYLPPESEPEPAVRTTPEARLAAAGESAAAGGGSLPAVPNLPEARTWYTKGSELYAAGSFVEAISCFDKALKLHPRLANAWAARGLACNALRQYQEAIRCYDESLRLDPRDPAVWHDKGNTLCAVGRLEGALNCYNEALIIDPHDARAWNNKGICLASLGRPEEALPCCSKATQLDAAYAVAWQAKAMIEERLVRIPDAVASYKRFIALASAGDAAAVERIVRHISVLEAGAQAETVAAA
jgi:tetratricopeptide (TPR) repeat protein